MPIDVRPLAEADLSAGWELARASLDGVSRRLDAVPHPPPPNNPARGEDRLRHAMTNDPASSFVADRDGEVVGLALAIRREGMWMLSLLAVAEGLQGEGIGSRLLAAARQTETDATMGLICSSRDPRALRRYHAAGFTLHPTFLAEGVLDRSLLPAGLNVRDGDADRDAELIDDVVRRLRGAGGASIDASWIAGWGASLLVAEDGPRRGFAVVRDGSVAQLAADDEALAARLLWAALAAAKPGEKSEVGWLGARQQWAIDTGMAARLSFGMYGAVALRGAVGPFAPYLPSGGFG